MKIDWIGDDNRAITIPRISSHRQKDNTSHEVQAKEMVEYAETNGLVITKSFPIIESAKDADERRHYNAAIEWALAKGIRHILFYMTDREGRNFTDIERNQKLIKQGKLVTHYVRDRKVLHKDSPYSDFMLRQFQAFQDKQLSEVIRIKVNDAMRAKAEEGHFPGNHPALGYMHQKMKDESGRERKRGTTIVPDSDPKAVRQVQREFELRAQRLSLLEIRGKVISEGLIAPERVRSYHISAIERRLKNKFYRGSFVWQGIEYQGRHELIIPPHILAAVDESFNLRARYTKKQKQGVFGGGWIKCANVACGCHVLYDPKTKIVKSSGETRTFHYYHCTNGKKAHVDMRGMNVREENLWEQFGAAVDEISITEDLAAKISDALNRTHQKACQAVKREIAGYGSALDQLDSKKDKLFDLRLAGELDESEFRHQSQRIKEERHQITALLEKSQLAINGAYLKTAQDILELATRAKSLWIQRSPQERKALFERVLSNPVLDGPIVRYDLKKPFAVLSRMRSDEDWRPLESLCRTPNLGSTQEKLAFPKAFL